MTDIFDEIEKLVAPEIELLKTQKQTTPIVARKPYKDEWIRVATEPHLKARTFYVYQPKEPTSAKPYLLMPDVVANVDICKVATKKLLFVAINRTGTVFLSLVGTGDYPWHDSSRLGHQQAQREWVRLVPADSQYAIMTAGFTEQPVFPDISFSDMLRSAFGESIIIDLNHPICREILGKPKVD